MKSRGQIDDRRLQEVRIVFAEIQLSELIRQPQPTVVCNVKEVSNEADSRAFVDHPRIIRVQIELEYRTACGQAYRARLPESHRHSGKPDAADTR